MRAGFASALVALAALLCAQTASAEPELVNAWGSEGSADGQFLNPNGLAVDGVGDVYVADTDNFRIQKFSADGTFLLKWGTSGSAAGQFSIPNSVAVDAGGNVYVADRQNHRVQKFTSTGGFLRMWGQGVAGGSGPEICTSAPSCVAGSPGGEGGAFVQPEAIAVGPDGSVYVTEFANQRVQKFTSDGVFQAAWGWGVDDGTAAFQICTTTCQAGISGSGDGQFARPVGVVANDVYIADRDNARVQRFAPSGSFSSKWGTPGSGDGQFGGSSPRDLAVEPSGSLLVADPGNLRIQRFTPEGAFLSTFNRVTGAVPETFQPGAVATNTQGDIYILDEQIQGDRVLRVREGGGPGPTTPPVTPATPAQPPATPAQGLPPPVLGERVNVRPLSGRVLARTPGSRRFVPLSATTQIAVGSLLDTRSGRVELTSAVDRAGNTQSGQFLQGVFQVRQSRSSGARGLTELRLTGSSFRRCRARRSAIARASGRRLNRRRIRRLRARARGRFRTRGRHSSATVRGTTWDTIDRCDGTLTRVTEGRVAVRDFARRRTVLLRAGRSYLARARR